MQYCVVPLDLQGCIELLKRSGVQMAGKTAAVVGRSNIVGLPVALLLQNEDATVTIVHSRTPNAGGQGMGGWKRWQRYLSACLYYCAGAGVS